MKHLLHYCCIFALSHLNLSPESAYIAGVGYGALADKCSNLRELNQQCKNGDTHEGPKSVHHIIPSTTIDKIPVSTTSTKVATVFYLLVLFQPGMPHLFFVAKADILGVEIGMTSTHTISHGAQENMHHDDNRSTLPRIYDPSGLKS